jgi:hypothetical protein
MIRTARFFADLFHLTLQQSHRQAQCLVAP